MTDSVDSKLFSTKYYEAHVTLEPVFEDRLEELKLLASNYGFRVADLLLQRRKRDQEQRSSKDSFCTGRSIDIDELHGRMTRMVKHLESLGFQVWRQKIEAVLFDERTKPSQPSQAGL